MSAVMPLSANRSQDVAVQRAEPVAAAPKMMTMKPSSEAAPASSPKTKTTKTANTKTATAKTANTKTATAKTKVASQPKAAAKTAKPKATKATKAKTVKAKTVEAAPETEIVRVTAATKPEAAPKAEAVAKTEVVAKAETQPKAAAKSRATAKPKTAKAKAAAKTRATAKPKTAKAKAAKPKTESPETLVTEIVMAGTVSAESIADKTAKVVAAKTVAAKAVKATKTTKTTKATKTAKVAKPEPSTEAAATSEAKVSTEAEPSTQPKAIAKAIAKPKATPAAAKQVEKPSKVARLDDEDDDDLDDDNVSPFTAVPAPLRRALEKKGFDRLTRVQRAALEAIEEGRDLQISSQTGSGKTVAVGMVMAPEILEHADEDRKNRGKRGPRALVIAPTRELATQVSDELSWLFAPVPGLKVLSVTGGTSVDRDRSRLASGPRILVGTPGRLLDHIRTGALDCQNISQLVLDEADQMLDMGFREELEAILDATPKERHTHLVSATFPYAIRRLAERYQRNPLQVEGTRLGVANEDIEHIVHVVHPHDRYAALVNTLLLARGERTLIFVKTRVETAELAEQLAEDGFSAAPISGDLQQGQRTRTLNSFRNGTVDILVATDVAARGLDIPDVGLVVHGTPPMDSESYTHRSGRTGRAGNKGRCVVLAPYYQRGLVSRLLSQARITASWEEPPSAKRVQKAQTKQVRREIYKALESEEPPSADLLDYSQRLLGDRDPALVVATLLQRFQPKPPTEPRDIGSSPRGRDAYRDDRGGPPRRSYGDRPDRGPRPQGGRPQSSRPSAGFTRFAINWGLRQGANPKRILAVVCRRGDVNGRQVGSINIDAHSSTFEVRDDVAEHFARQAQLPDPRDPKIRVKKL